MEDRFKFRFWHEIEKRWFYFNFYNFEMYKDRIQKYCLDDGKQVYQCTGLKDKNGKLIYELDIVKTFIGNFIIRYCYICKSYQLFSVEEDYCFSCEGDLHWFEFLEELDKTEIIGNIYENPELLETNNLQKTQ